MMELRLPTLEQLRTVYDADLLKAFPAAELKPLRNMEELWKWIATGPGASLTGTRSWANAFCGWAIPAGRCWIICAFPPASATRGLGAAILRKLQEVEPDTVIFGESEAPEDADDPAMAERRLGFMHGTACARLDTIRRCSAYIIKRCICSGRKWTTQR